MLPWKGLSTLRPEPVRFQTEPPGLLPDSLGFLSSAGDNEPTNTKARCYTHSVTPALSGRTE